MMTVKKFPIVAAWQVNLYCDKCGEIMEYFRFDYDPDRDKCRYVHKCKCGHEEKTIQQYPHQIVQFDTSKAEEVE